MPELFDEVVYGQTDRGPLRMMGRRFGALVVIKDPITGALCILLRETGLMLISQGYPDQSQEMFFSTAEELDASVNFKAIEDGLANDTSYDVPSHIQDLVKRITKEHLPGFDTFKPLTEEQRRFNYQAARQAMESKNG